MVNKRRGLLGVVLILSLIAFVGFSLGPLLGGIFGASQPRPAATPTPAQVAQSQQADLQAQARGYEMVLQREPKNETALRGFLQAKLELISLGQGDVKDVVSPLEQLSEMHPETTEYSILLAQARQYTGNQEAAAQTYRTILEKQPGQVQALQGYVNLLLTQQRPEAAIGLLQETLKASPQANQAQPGSIDETSVQLILGQVYAEQKRYSEAIAIYDEAIKANEQDFRPVLAKAIVLKEQGNLNEAEPLFAKAAEIAPAAYKDQIQKQGGLEIVPESEALPQAIPSPKADRPEADKSESLSPPETDPESSVTPDVQDTQQRER
ncbi:MAG: tetratricopeptide repeat protein [Microcoleaceae cyanobacterium]